MPYREAWRPAVVFLFARETTAEGLNSVLTVMENDADLAASMTSYTSAVDIVSREANELRKQEAQFREWSTKHEPVLRYISPCPVLT